MRDGKAVGFVLLGLAIFFWGTSFRATAVVIDHTSPAVLSALRAGGGALVLLALLPMLGARLPPRRLWGWTALTGIVGVALFYEGLAEGAERAGAGPTAVLVNSTPFFVLVAGWVFLQERVTWRGILGLVVGFAGVVLIVSSQLGSDVSTSDLIIGSVLALAAAIGWGVTTLIIKWLVVRESSLDLVGLTAGQHVVGAVALVLLAVGIGDSGQATDWGSGELWGGVAFLAIGSSAIAYLAFFAALRRVEAAQASAWLFLVPVVAVVVELALGEVPDGIVLVGMALAIAGVALISLFGQPKDEETSVPHGASPHGEHLR